MTSACCLHNPERKVSLPLTPTSRRHVHGPNELVLREGLIQRQFNHSLSNTEPSPVLLNIPKALASISLCIYHFQTLHRDTRMSHDLRRKRSFGHCKMSINRSKFTRKTGRRSIICTVFMFQRCEAAQSLPGNTTFFVTCGVHKGIIAKEGSKA
jgi:hypothetical protein